MGVDGTRIKGVFRGTVDTAISMAFENFRLGIARVHNVDILEFVEGTLGYKPLPYQVEPLLEYAKQENKKLVFMCSEQLGKSAFNRFCFCYDLYTEKGLKSLYVYESEDKGKRVSRAEFLPLIEKIPTLSGDINRATFTSSEIHLGGNTCYFLGSGSPITSYTVSRTFADEIDLWTSPEGEQDRLIDLEKRVRSAPSPRKQVYVCTPSYPSGNINRMFSQSSRGRWFLRCTKCRKLTIPSYAINGVFSEKEGGIIGGLQWRKLEDGTPDYTSIRLVCPECGHEHEEKEHDWMTEQGGFVHEKPQIEDIRGFQLGALASPFRLHRGAFSWKNLVDKIRAGTGEGSTFETQYDLMTSYQGLPYRPRKNSTNEDAEIKIMKHTRDIIPVTDFDYLLMGVDTQDASWYYTVTGWRTLSIKARDGEVKIPQCQVLAVGNVASLDELERVYLQGFEERPIVSLIIDAGGHRADVVKDFCSRLTGVKMWKGAGTTYFSSSGATLRYSNDDYRLILGREEYWRVKLLAAMEVESDEKIIIRPDVDRDMARQIFCYAPDPKKIRGFELKNWKIKGEQPDHLFDCLKMVYAYSLGRIELGLQDWGERQRALDSTGRRDSNAGMYSFLENTENKMTGRRKFRF